MVKSQSRELLDFLLSNTKPSKKPKITKVEKTSDITLKLSSFLPNLKAANEALPNDKSLDIENLNDAENYIEMDLGLGVLEERPEELKLTHKPPPVITEVSDINPHLKHADNPQLQEILNLMTRILRQLRKRHTKVSVITKLNVLQEDMLKLMRRRDAILGVQGDEVAYLRELDELVS